MNKAARLHERQRHEREFIDLDIVYFVVVYAALFVEPPASSASLSCFLS
jgi:hypothetical protein